MFRIRKDQRAAFADLARRKFERALAEHLRAHFPARCAALGEDGARELAALAVDRGRRHGFVTERQVTLFANLLAGLGPGFDEDRARPWARRILSDPTYHHADQRLNALYDEAERREPESMGAQSEEETEA